VLTCSFTTLNITQWNIQEAGVKELGLFHHNQDRTDQAIDAMVDDCNLIIKDRGQKLICSAVATGTEREL